MDISSKLPLFLCLRLSALFKNKYEQKYKQQFDGKIPRNLPE